MPTRPAETTTATRAGSGRSAGRLCRSNGPPTAGRAPNPYGTRVWLRMTNDRHIVTYHHGGDGKRWTKFDRQMKVSAYHHNVRGGFLALKSALFVAREGEARFLNFRHRAL